MDIYRYDESFRKDGYQRIAGLDEAGRGPLAGPVVASAVVLPSGKRIEGLRDSKKVPEKERGSLFMDVLCACVDVGVGIVDAETIDRINILNATRLAMQRAVEDLSKKADLLLIDALQIASLDIKQVSLIKGESKSASIAAASIIAKVVRDGIMTHYDGVYPAYGFGRHKGYSTQEHMEKIMLHGPCPIHRRSFERVLTRELPFGDAG
jgi:ribonuclease HII